MLKTIKIKKQMRLDELIKYVWDNGINNEDYYSDLGNHVSVGVQTLLWTNGIIGKNDTFTVEVEEEIDYGTVFEEVYRVTKEGYVTSDKNKSIDSCLDWKDYQVQIFAMLDGRLQLIWEADEDVN